MTKVGMREVSVKGTLMKSDPVIESALSYISDTIQEDDMVDTKKEQERDELHRAIWAIADELRGAVDGWDFKNYVLGTMFYRYISENLSDYITRGERAAGDTGFDYVTMPDEDAEGAREGLVQEKGFFILPSELFCNVCARAKDDENLNETLETVFRHIEESAKAARRRVISKDYLMISM